MPKAKATGFDVKALRAIVRLRKQDADERKEQEAILETYMHALGMLNVRSATLQAPSTLAPQVCGLVRNIAGTPRPPDDPGR